MRTQFLLFAQIEHIIFQKILTIQRNYVIIYTDQRSVWRCNMARNKYPEQTVKLILDVATRLFVEKGYEQTSLQDIIN